MENTLTSLVSATRLVRGRTMDSPLFYIYSM